MTRVLSNQTVRSGSGGGTDGRGRGGLSAGLPVAVEESPADQQVYVNLADG